MTVNSETYRDQLLTTEQQLEQLFLMDERWGRIGRSVLYGLPVDSQPQELDDMRVLHVELGSLGETFAGWRNQALTAMYGFAHWNSMLIHADQIDECTSLREQTMRYEPGVYEVHLDLTRDRDTFSNKSDVKTLEEVLATVKESGEFF
jgi:hypothetical protein